ncbi:RNA polymerase sigma factor [Singulisphaera sp. PoT]|uniref:RNA polymerase sigma factor n=1 Tax=Singulisphaera sp. PoT TaxID=3411797 RepID=UPI003BF5C3AD
MGESRPEVRQTSLTLLERVRANEADAWTRLIDLYTPMLRYWCARAGLQSSDADDVIQEVCRSAMAGLPDFQRDRPGDTFRGWLRVITRNALALHFRRKGRHPSAPGGTEAFLRLEELADPRPDLPDEDSQAQIQGLYRRALELVRGEFEDRTWQMFWLTVVEDKVPNDVAAQFGVSAVAVRKAKSRVLLRLRQEVGDLIA